jgi:hypothetical protein
MGYSPTYRDVETGNRKYDEKSRCSCIGFLGICIAMMIFGIMLMIPGMLNGSIIFVGGAATFIPLILMLFAPFVICAIVIKLSSGYREKSEIDNLQ